MKRERPPLWGKDRAGFYVRAQVCRLPASGMKVKPEQVKNLLRRYRPNTAG
jgi:hypothetical protein